MAGSVFDSRLLADLFPTGHVGKLFTDSAEIRAMMLVEGALARAQGQLAVIPEDSAGAISRASIEVQIDPAALTEPTGKNGVSVPGFVAAFRKAMQAPEHAQYLHWGATSQDILDTALMLRLRQSLAVFETGLHETVSALATLAERHADLPMAARTYGQHATPTSFGAVTASWGQPLLSLLQELPDLRQACLQVSLAGAAGTASALGPKAPEIRALIAEDLGLTDPGRSWHTDRTAVLRLSDWCTRVTLATGKMGEDLVELVMSGIGEVQLGGAGASSTMPQKQNPVSPSALVALSNQTVGQHNILQSAGPHKHQRDGAAWFTEWMCLPQIVLGCAASLEIAKTLVPGLSPVADKMLDPIDGNLGLIHAEALSFALAETMPRPEAQAHVKRLCKEAMDTDTSLVALVARDFPTAGIDLSAAQQMGQSALDAAAFVRAARATK